MPKNSFLKALFPSLKYSLSPIDVNTKGTVKIGKIVPVFATMLNGKESIELDESHLVRFMPTNVPVMEGYRVDFDAFAVPLTAIAYAERMERDAIDFHNLALNPGDELNPFSHQIPDVTDMNGRSQVADYFRSGSLSDYLGWPSFKAFRDYLRSWIAKTPLFDGSFGNRVYISDEGDGLFRDVFDFVARYFVGFSAYMLSDDTATLSLDGSGRGHGQLDYYLSIPFTAKATGLYPRSYSDWSTTVSGPLSGWFASVSIPAEGSGFSAFTVSVRSLLRYICENYTLVADYYGLNYNGVVPVPTTALNHLLVRAENGELNLNYLQVLYELYKIDAQSIFEEWFEKEIVAYFLYNNDLHEIYVSNGSWMPGNTLAGAGYLPDLSRLDPVDFSYHAAYWKIISDWYINTNVDGNPDEFFVQHCSILKRFQGDGFRVDNEPFVRRWGNDIFTSAVPSAAADDIKIPVDGTIPELREANSYQRIKDILRNVGNRAKDVMYGIRGYTPTAQASEMSIPVGTLHSYIGIQSVLQTSQTTPESAQASYSGIGTDSTGGRGRRILKVINNSEPVPVVVMVLMSVTQRSAYMQGFPRKFFRNTIYDFAIPELANVGEQAVYTKELFFDYEPSALAPENDEIWAFNRRYYDWFFEANSVHGEMRDSQDFWHGARIFDSKPALNPEFIGIQYDADHLSRVFANISPAADPIVFNISFEGSKVVALPRYIQYEL